MDAIITAVNQLTGERETVSSPMPVAQARQIIEDAAACRAPRAYDDYKLQYIKTKDTMTLKIEELPRATRAGVSVEIDRQDFALTLKTYRLRQQMTQQQLAERWGVSRFLIIKAEGAKPLTWERAYQLFAKLSRELETEHK